MQPGETLDLQGGRPTDIGTGLGKAAAGLASTTARTSSAKPSRAEALPRSCRHARGTQSPKERPEPADDARPGYEIDEQNDPTVAVAATKSD